MIRRCIPLAVLSVLLLGMPLPAQETKTISAKEAEAMRKTHALLQTQLSIKGRELPLAKISNRRKELPEGRRRAHRCKGIRQGRGQGEAKVRLPNLESVALGRCFAWSWRRLTLRHRLSPGINEFVVTTPAAAQYTYGYDVRDLLTIRPAAGSLRGADEPTCRGSALTGNERGAGSIGNDDGRRTIGGIQHGSLGPAWHHPVANGNRLVIHASRTSTRRSLSCSTPRAGSTTSASLDTRLYSVDRETYTG